MNNFIQVFTTTGQRSNAELIAKKMVEKRLSACVQISGPIISTYWWKGSIEVDEEWICVIKTRDNLFDEVERAIKEDHPYEVPEILAIPVLRGSSSYLAWLQKELKK